MEDHDQCISVRDNVPDIKVFRVNDCKRIVQWFDRVRVRPTVAPQKFLKVLVSHWLALRMVRVVQVLLGVNER